MKYKISELVARTNIPKSTILYYIKEGLLPQAQKIKPNVHRYSDEHIELIKYIKYMQHQMNSSNEEIKTILQNKNSSLSSSFSMITPLMQTLSKVPKDTKHYTKEEFVKAYDVDIKLLNRLLADDILMPLNNDDFTDKEGSIINLIKNFKSVGVEYAIIKDYALCAKNIAKIEVDMQKKLCNVRSDENFSTLWNIMFETLLNTKEYIFNRHTHKALHNALKDEISNLKH